MAGMAALIHAWYDQNTRSMPSPAMTKAIMLASGTSIAGGDDGNSGTIGELPNPRQGWGLLNMGRLTDGSSMYFFDQDHVFTSSGQDFSPVPMFTAVDPTRPVRIMLVYTDAPGNPNASPSGGLANDLDLEVTVGGEVYLGNNFSGGASVPGGVADGTNNVEAVYFPAGAVTTFSLRIIASDLTGDALPGDANPTDQDFALFLYNATDQSADGVVSLSSSTYSCSDTITITVSDEDLQGAGTQDVSLFSDSEPTPITITLSEDPPGTGILSGSYPTTGAAADPGDGMLSVSDGDTITAEYLDADTGSGGPTAKTATADADCAGPVITAVQVPAATLTDATAVVTWTTDEAASSQVIYGIGTPDTVTAAPGNSLNHAVNLTGLQGCTRYSYQVTSCDRWGNCSTDPIAAPFYVFTTGLKMSIFEDDVEGGAGGWTAEGDWAISDEASNSPSHAWSDSPGGDYGASVDASLISPVLDLTSAAGPELSFFHTYELESGYDYGYLEATTDGVAWSTLATFNGSQPDWAEVSVDMSAYAGFPSVQIRFRIETDSIVHEDGWHVDDIQLFSYGSCAAGNLMLDRAVYDCDDPIVMNLMDMDLNTDPGLQETTTISIISDTELTPEIVTLTEANADSSWFSGYIDLTTGAAGSDGLLSITSGDMITATYQDADNGTGSPATVIATATADCEAPIISNVQITAVTTNGATISWTTDEPADSRVDWFATDPPASGSILDEQMVLDHEIVLSGLASCTTHSINIASTDYSDHETKSMGHEFTTALAFPLDIDSTDTPLSIPDSTPSGVTSTITVAETMAVADVNVMINITHTFDGDLDISLIGPDGTTVELTSDNGGTGENFIDTVFDDDASQPITGGSAPFTGSYQPEQPLSVLNGLSAQGNWQLLVVDDASADLGTLNSWQLQLILSEPCTNDGIFSDDFESGDHGSWSEVVP